MRKVISRICRYFRPVPTIVVKAGKGRERRSKYSLEASMSLREASEWLNLPMETVALANTLGILQNFTMEGLQRFEDEQNMSVWRAIQINCPLPPPPSVH